MRAALWSAGREAAAFGFGSLATGERKAAAILVSSIRRRRKEGGSFAAGTHYEGVPLLG
jgi:hypothetical protein